MKKILMLLLGICIGYIPMAAEIRNGNASECSDTYIVVRACPALNLERGDEVQVTISKPNSTSTPIYVSNVFKTEFTMVPDNGGMGHAGQGYSSGYKINGSHVWVQRDSRSINVSQGKYSFELKRK